MPGKPQPLQKSPFQTGQGSPQKILSPSRIRSFCRLQVHLQEAQLGMEMNPCLDPFWTQQVIQYLLDGYPIPPLSAIQRAVGDSDTDELGLVTTRGCDLAQDGSMSCPSCFR